MERICCIYCIECISDGRKYIGQTVDFVGRKRGHMSSLRNRKHSNDCLQKAWDKYGEDNFKVYIVHECVREELDALERYYIEFYHTLSHQNGFNIEAGGSAKKKVPQRTKDLISLHHADVSGKNNPMYGVKMPKESVNKTLSNPNYINRRHRGEDSHMCSITEDIARKIKHHFADGHTPYRGEVTDIANLYNTNAMIVSHIKNGHAWAWLSV